MQNRTKPRNLQDAFNRVWRHFIIHGYGASKEITGRCAYRGVDKKNAPACAVGCMLPNVLAKKADDLPSSSIERACQIIPEIDKWFREVPIDALSQLQWIHDNEFGKMKSNLEGFAKRNDLTIPKR
jgi:hypothetical protein